MSRFRRRRVADNRAEREADCRHRLQILEGVADSLKQGLSRSAALDCAAISSGTWRNWRRWQQAGRPPLARRGRPPRCATASERQRAIGFLVEHGSQVPLHALRQHVPTVPRCELADLRSRYQHIVCWRRERRRGRLLWKRVGAVWSMDFTEPKEYIGGTDRWILAIRDLASGYQLAWLSFAQATAECVVQVLKELFTEHGPPLVLKSDNGSQFIAEVTLNLLAQWQVEPLFNPPRRPAYNGGLERTHPILKGYTESAAAAQGRPAGVLSEDLHTGRTNANRFTRRFGDDGPTAEEAWQARQPISVELRVAFRLTVQARRPVARAARGLSEDAVLNHYQRAAIDRHAIREALEVHDLLEIVPHHRRGLRPGGPTARLAPSVPPALAVAVAGQDSAESALSLAPSDEETCTIAPACAVSPNLGNAATPAAPAHGEPLATNTLRRLITPLIHWLRRAKIR